MKITIPAEALRDPEQSETLLIRNEDAGDCDGSVCGLLGFDERGEECYPGPHHHLVEAGQNPQAGPRIHPV
jgi:hypothetical protein